MLQSQKLLGAPVLSARQTASCLEGRGGERLQPPWEQAGSGHHRAGWGGVRPSSEILLGPDALGFRVYKIRGLIEMVLKALSSVTLSFFKQKHAFLLVSLNGERE